MMAQAAGDLGAVVSRQLRLEAVGKWRELGQQVFRTRRPMSPVEACA